MCSYVQTVTEKGTTVTKVLIDGDIIAYRSAFHAKDQDLSVAIGKCDQLINKILERTLFIAAPHEYQVYLTGKGNFRFEIAKSHV